MAAQENTQYKGRVIYHLEKKKQLLEIEFWKEIEIFIKKGNCKVWVIGSQWTPSPSVVAQEITARLDTKLHKCMLESKYSCGCRKVKMNLIQKISL